MKTKYVVLLLSTLFLLASCGGKKEKEEPPRSVKIYEVKAASGGMSISFPGKVKAQGEAQLSFRIAGPIHKIYAKAGKKVRKGEVLAVMDQRDYNTQLAATEAEYQSVKAQAERIIRLYEQQSVSTNDYDKAVGALKQINQKLIAHKNAVGDTRLIAPYDGYIQEPLRKEGETVGAGMPVLSFYSDATPEVEINIVATDYLKRDTYQSYSCTIDAYPGVIFPLELVSIDPIANLNQLYTMRLRFVPVEGQTMPTIGMSTMVKINLKDSGQRGTNVPFSAIWEKGEKSYVWVVKGGDTAYVEAHEVQVTEVSRTGMAVCQGIEENVSIVTAGVYVLKEGQKVKPIAPTSKTNVGGLL